MSHLSRRGFTLVELLIALVLIGIVSGGVYRVLVANQRMYQAQTQRIDMLQNMRAGLTILPAELREISASEGDIRTMTATSITFRGMRQVALLCTRPVLGTTSPVFAVRQDPLFGSRPFDARRDSLLVYYEGNESVRTDDGWIIGRITAVTAGACADGNAAWLLATNMDFGGRPNVTGAIQSGSPVRGFTPVTYQLYTSGGRPHIGVQEAGATMQPLIGPLANNGLTLEYYDATGVTTAVPANVTTVSITLRAETERAFRQLDGTIRRAVDSVTTWVSLRNNLRY